MENTFSIKALINLINTNDDKVISQKEMKRFLETQDTNQQSVFTKYFQSIKTDVAVDEFGNSVYNMTNSKTNNAKKL